MAQSIDLGGSAFWDASALVDGEMTLNKTRRSYSGDIDTTYTDSSHAMYIYRMGKMRVLFLNVHVTGSFPIATLTDMVTLDEEDIPDVALNIGFCSQDGYPGLISITTAGVLRFYKNVSNTSYMWFRGTWVYFVA